MLTIHSSNSSFVPPKSARPTTRPLNSAREDTLKGTRQPIRHPSTSWTAATAALSFKLDYELSINFTGAGGENERKREGYPDHLEHIGRRAAESQKSLIICANKQGLNRLQPWLSGREPGVLWASPPPNLPLPRLKFSSFISPPRYCGKHDH